MKPLNETSGHCFCGAVQLVVSGAPALQGVCHCESCRRWSASPMNAFTLWKPEQVRVTIGEDSIDSFEKTASSVRSWCKECGGHLFTHHPGMGLTDVYAAVIPDFPFAAELHVHYQEHCMSVPDGLPKFRNLPAEAGGSGETLPD